RQTAIEIAAMSDFQVSIRVTRIIADEPQTICADCGVVVPEVAAINDDQRRTTAHSVYTVGHFQRVVAGGRQIANEPETVDSDRDADAWGPRIVQGVQRRARTRSVVAVGDFHAAVSRVIVGYEAEAVSSDGNRRAAADAVGRVQRGGGRGTAV